MASQYDFSMYDSDSDEEPSDKNMWAAAIYIGRLFETNEISYAMMGGFLMKLRGSTRSTTDLDVAVSITMRQLWSIITPQPRLIVPNTRLIEGTMRLFARTGPTVGDNFCEMDQKVVVDIAVNMPVENNRELISFHFNGEQYRLYGLSVHYTMKLKLRAFAGRHALKDFLDIIHLLQFYSAEILCGQDQFDRDNISFFCESQFFEELEEDRKANYRVLLEA